jgi:AP2-associated kinase
MKLMPSFLSGLGSSLKSLAKDVVSKVGPDVLQFGEVSVVATDLIAEGGFSYVYTAREVAATMAPKQFALKKVLVQDAETRALAEVEIRVLHQFSGQRGFVVCYGSFSRPAASPAGATEYWMLLELCPNGSLIDLLYRRPRGGGFERLPTMPQLRILRIFEQVAGAVASMHAADPPVMHRDLKLENVLVTASHSFVLCDFGSACTEVLPAERTRQRALVEEERIHK